MLKDKKVAFVGAGLIGSGLAVNCALHGANTYIQSLEPAEKTRQNVTNALDILKKHGVIDEEQWGNALSCCVFTDSISEAVSGAFFIQESVPESLEIKQSTLKVIEESAPKDAIIASSTSGMLVSDIFAKARYPQRCMGGHPYLPAYLMPLIEITKGNDTAEEYVVKAKEFYKMIGKEPVVLNKEVVGFIANRYQSAIHREAVALVEQGVCSVEDADKALIFGVGIRWGIMGQFLTLHVGAAPGGIGSFNEKYHIDASKADKRLESLATWTTFPKDWDKHAEEGVNTEISNRSEEIGKDIPSIENWRDHMLVEILKLHGRL